MVSVIIPTYNRENVIERSIRSVLDQTYKDLEVLVVDDCSTDNTRSVVESIIDERLHYCRLEKNAGACVARNRGIELARGEYIAFQDSDDVWLPGKLEKQMKIFEKTAADLMFCKLNYHTKYGIQQIPKRLQTGFISSKASLFGIGTQSIVAKRNVFEDIRFDASFPRYQDLELLYRVGKTYSIYCLAEGLVEYSVGTDSISSNPEKLYQACCLLLERHPEIREARPVMMKQMAYTLLRTAREVKCSGTEDYHKYIALSKYCKRIPWLLSIKECVAYLRMGYRGK